MNDHIAKPIDPNKLFLAMSKWIKPQKQDVLSITESPDPLPLTVEDFPPMPGIESATGLFHSGGKATLYRTLLAKFAKNNTDFVAEFTAALAKGDREEARRKAHTLKGASGTIGASRLQSLTTELESSLVLPPEFVAELELVLASIAGLFSASPNAEAATQSQPATIDPAVLRHILESLRPHIEKKRPKNCEPILEELGQIALPVKIQESLEELVKLIKKYKLKEALPVLDAMIEQVTNGGTDKST